MSTKDLLSLSVFVAGVVLLYKSYSYNIQTPQHQNILARDPIHNFSWKLKTGTIKSEICVGRGCASTFFNQQKKSDTDFLISITVLVLIGVAVHLTIKNQKRLKAENLPTRQTRKLASEPFKKTFHSTSIECFSLSPSPVQPVAHPGDNKRHTIPWNQMTGNSDYEVCLSLHPSPLPSPNSSINSFSYLSDSLGSTSGVYPALPPRRWLGNSRLNIVTSPEVLPRDLGDYYYL